MLAGSPASRRFTFARLRRPLRFRARRRTRRRGRSMRTSCSVRPGTDSLVDRATNVIHAQVDACDTVLAGHRCFLPPVAGSIVHLPGPTKEAVIRALGYARGNPPPLAVNRVSHADPRALDHERVVRPLHTVQRPMERHLRGLGEGRATPAALMRCMACASLGSRASSCARITTAFTSRHRACGRGEVGSSERGARTTERRRWR